MSPCASPRAAYHSPVFEASDTTVPATRGATVPPLALAELTGRLAGELRCDDTTRAIYATDASAYQQTPLAVAIPKTEDDLVELVRFAGRHGVGLIPRTAGTSLAGQVVGDGIVVDVSRHFTEIIEIAKEPSSHGRVRVQPGVIRNELNAALAPHGLVFGPETSTQNRAMLGGMLGNNSCGSNSLRYGSTRDHVIEVKAILSDGSRATFGPLTAAEFAAKCDDAGDGPDSLHTRLYRHIRESLSDPATREEIARRFPDPRIRRRNTGYALDALSQSSAFDPQSDRPFHFGELIAGSEGTLCLVTEITLHCDPLPPPVAGLQCAQFASVDQALRATQLAVAHDPFAVELIDHHILACTERSIEHRQNRFFLQGEPQAVLVTELRGDTRDQVQAESDRLAERMRAAGLGYAYPTLFGPESLRVWELRKAGLGLLGNIVGDEKSVPVIEDTAVTVDDLPDYIAEIDRMMAERFGLEVIHYAHAGSGELHLRPIINLKTADGHRLFREVAQAVAEIVRRYRGSLSGEHGDGRLRGEFLREMIGEANYELARGVKRAWDPGGVFNPGKIIDTPPMNTHLRYDAGAAEAAVETLFDWSATQGLLRAAEMCNGSGDCRKTHHAGGTMCPSYMATRNEADTTRARANMLRRALTVAPGQTPSENPLANAELNEVLDLCLSCKGCKSECPSTVDMAKMKAEFQQAWHDAHGVPRRTRLIARFAASQRLVGKAPWLWNAAFSRRGPRRLLNRLVGFHPDRSIPPANRVPFRRWFDRHEPHATAGTVGRVLLFADEFTDALDLDVGIAAVELLERLGYAITIPDHEESGRSMLSKGLVREAREIIARNVAMLEPLVSDDVPLVGLEPSAILTFRDEAIDLATDATRERAGRLAARTLTLEEFLVAESSDGRLPDDAFDDAPRTLLVHGHCFQKALVGMSPTVAALSLMPGAEVRTIPSGCCGMAGSFGYEAEHYDLSMQIGELVLLPAVREAGDDAVIVAAGTSCRHQIHDGAGRRAVHPAVALRDALVSDA